ncbi:MAG: transporter substrate-binding domain-containing protein [Methanomassiliicoccales archaeon]|nr:transporter substrate-binding domain-containing protein [Methanomassiliicoccales archaeon]
MMRDNYRALKAFGIVIVVALLSSSFLGCIGGTQITPDVIKNRGKLIMGTSGGFPPFEVINETTQQLEGLDIDLAQRIADELGVSLEVRDMDFTALIGSVKTGQIDMAIAGMSITDTRNGSVTFSSPYFKADQAIVVKSDRTDISTTDDLAGMKISVNQGTTGDYWVADNLVATGMVAAEDVHKFGYASDALLELVAGRVDALVIDTPVAAAYVANNAGIKVVYTIVTNEYYGIVMNQKSVELVDFVNELLAEMEASGEMQQLVDRWF